MSDLLLWAALGLALALAAASYGMIGGWRGLVGCSHHATVSQPGRAFVMYPVRCRLRMAHSGPHFYGEGWEEA